MTHTQKADIKIALAFGEIALHNLSNYPSKISE